MICHTLQQNTWLCTLCTIYLFNFIEWMKMRDWHKMKIHTLRMQSLIICIIFAYSSSVIWPCMCVCVWENGLKPFSVERFLVHGCDLWGVWNSLHIFVLKNLAPYMAVRMPIYALYDPSVQFWHLKIIMFLFLDCLSANLLLSAYLEFFFLILMTRDISLILNKWCSNFIVTLLPRLQQAFTKTSATA